MTTTQNTQLDVIQNFQERGQQIQSSFEAIKNNPLNFNLLMSHIGLLSATVHELIAAQYPSTISSDNNE